MIFSNNAVFELYETIINDDYALYKMGHRDNETEIMTLFSVI